MMSGIKGKNTKPELFIRKAIHALGYRYRLHVRDLPGNPDIVFPKFKAVVFIHGCFWHLHDCHLFKWPKTRADFWKRKITRNKYHDEESIQMLSEKGWRVLIVWECAIKGKHKKDLETIIDECVAWLKGHSPFLEIRGKDADGVE